MIFTKKIEFDSYQNSHLVAISADAKREALNHRRELRLGLDALLDHIKKGDLASAHHSVLSVNEHVAGVDEFLSTAIEPIYYNEHITKEGVAAKKTFAIPELLESILQHVEALDLMRGCYAVNRTFRDTIEGSEKLQMKLFLRPALQGSKEVCPIPPSYSCHFRNPSPPSTGRLHAVIGQDSSNAFPTIGSRWKRMFFSQPPIYRVTAYRECDPRGMLNLDNSQCPGYTFRSESGLTVGDLYEEAKRVCDIHSACRELGGGPGRNTFFRELIEENEATEEA